MSEKDLTDKELILSFQATTSNKTFESIYDRHAPFIYKKCLQMTGSEADSQDLTQEVWIKVYFALEKFRFDSAFSSWLNRIVINTCINYIKKKGTFDLSEEIEETQNGSIPDINYHLDVTKMLSRLSIQERMLLVLKYIEGFSYDEIAGMTAMGVSAVKMKIARAKKEIGKYLSNKDYAKKMIHTWNQAKTSQ